MSGNAQPSASGISELFHVAFGLAVLPFVALLSPRALMRGGVMRRSAGIDTQANAEYLASLRRPVPVDAARTKALKADITRLADANDWTGVAAELRALDRDRAEDGQGRRLSELALDYLRFTLADQVYAPTMCNYEHYFDIPDGALERVRRAQQANPRDAYLTAILAQVHIDRGWAARGGGWSDEVSEDGWRGLLSSFDVAANLLAPLKADELDAPTIARIRFQLLAGMEASVTEAREFYHAWSDCDRSDQEPHAAYSFYVLPRWFGSWKQHAIEAHAAADRTREATGDAAYASFYLTAIGYEDEAIEYLDVGRFERGLNDLCTQSANPSFTALRLLLRIMPAVEEGFVPIWQEVTRYDHLARMTAIRAVLRRMLERHLTELPTEGEGRFESAALKAIATLCRGDLTGDSEWRLTPEGMRIGPAV